MLVASWVKDLVGWPEWGCFGSWSMSGRSDVLMWSGDGRVYQTLWESVRSLEIREEREEVNKYLLYEINKSPSKRRNSILGLNKSLIPSSHLHAQWTPPS